MKQPAHETIRLPIRGTYTVDRRSGEIINRQLEYAELPTRAVAEFLLTSFGLDPENLQVPDPSEEGKRKPVTSARNTHDGK